MKDWKAKKKGPCVGIIRTQETCLSVGKWPFSASGIPDALKHKGNVQIESFLSREVCSCVLQRLCCVNFGFYKHWQSTFGLEIDRLQSGTSKEQFMALGGQDDPHGAASAIPQNGPECKRNAHQWKSMMGVWRPCLPAAFVRGCIHAAETRLVLSMQSIFRSIPKCFISANYDFTWQLCDLQRLGLLWVKVRHLCSLWLTFISFASKLSPSVSKFSFQWPQE